MLQRWRKCSNVFIVGHCSSECFHGVWMLSFKKKKKRETEGGIFRSQIWAASISSVILYGRALNWVEKMVGPDYSFKWTGPNSQLAWKALSGLGNGGKRRGSAAGRGSSATVRVTEGKDQHSGGACTPGLMGNTAALICNAGLDPPWACWSSSAIFVPVVRHTRITKHTKQKSKRQKVRHRHGRLEWGGDRKR